MPTTEIYDESPDAMDKALSALDDLCDEIDGLDDVQERIMGILDPNSGGRVEEMIFFGQRTPDRIWHGDCRTSDQVSAQSGLL